MRNSTVIVLAIIVLSTSGTIMLAGCAGSGAHEQTLAELDNLKKQSAAAPTNTASVLQGKLLKIDGEFYVVKDASGKEVRVHVGKDTVLDGRIKVGDKIDAQVSADGHAATVLKALE